MVAILSREIWVNFNSGSSEPPLKLGMDEQLHTWFCICVDMVIFLYSNLNVGLTNLC